MDPKYDHSKYEQEIYSLWEKTGGFKPSGKGKPYTILMPPPNANASLHAGHAMYTVDDILVRYKRMQGYSAVWIPGMDHAGFETQYVYEKELAKKGQSRLDFDRQTLYQNISAFVEQNCDLIYQQMKRLGFSADWDRSVYAASPEVIKFVYETFRRMEAEGFIYRDDYLINYCPHCGTSLAELEVKHLERKDPLYFIKYGPFTLATVRPETKFGDTAVAVHPDDQRYQKWVGQEIEVEGLLGKFKLKVIADRMVDPKFGTGVVKITPAHDPNDFEAGRRHNLEIKQVIDHTGRLTEITGPYAGLKTMAARERVVADLKKKGLLVKVDPDYAHAVTVCYKCGRDLEPMITPNWFIKVKDLKTKVRETIEKDRVKFFPHRFKKHLLTWLDIMHDWPISRQIAWAIRIPAWYAVAKNPRLQVTFLDQKGQRVAGEIKTLLAKYSFTEIEKGLQTLVAPKDAAYEIAFAKPKGNYLQETDTFDTWFSSGQWPLLVLEKAELKTRFPTDVLGTLSDILKFWVSRMILFSLYLTNQVPFKDVYLWSMVADAKGIKMSKSKGNVVNPIALVEKYGADALRFSLLYGSPAGSKVILSDDKVRAMRNFANKIWNLGRFLQMSYQGTNPSDTVPKDLQAADQKILFELNQLIQKTTAALDGYRLNEAAELIYGFAWHTFADKYVEETKERTKHKDRAALYTLRQIYLNILKLLHPFMPFVTEQIWREISSLRQSPDQLLIKTAWPKP